MSFFFTATVLVCLSNLVSNYDTVLVKHLKRLFVYVLNIAVFIA
jgi:hypothetical protein